MRAIRRAAAVLVFAGLFAGLAGFASFSLAQSYPPPPQSYPPPPPQNYPPSPPPQQGYPPPAQGTPPPPGTLSTNESRFNASEIVNAGHNFFGTVSRGLAEIVEKAVSQWGLPNGYVLGEEAGGAFVAGLRYGEGVLYTKNAGDLKVYWQGPSIGWDAGAEGARTMMLIYNLPNTASIYERFGGVDGSAYLIGGFGMTALTANKIVVVPIRSGVGLRLGANLGYLKFTPQPTWNPL